MTPHDSTLSVLSSPLISDDLCRQQLGSSKYSTEAAHRYMLLPLQLRPDLSVFFDRQYYLDRYPDIATAGIDPLLHFFACGYSEGRSPHPLVDLAHIKSLDKHLLVGNGGVNELHEVLTYNLANPSPYFSLDYYRGHIPPDDEATDGLLAHFLTQGIEAGLRPNPFLDLYWYADYQIGEPGDPFSALRHFVLRGDAEGRAASPRFSGTRYFQRYSDVERAGFPALAHYLTAGIAERRACFPEQDDNAQLATLIRGQLDASTASIEATQVAASYNLVREKIDRIREQQKNQVTVETATLLRFKELAAKVSELRLKRWKKPRVSVLVPIYNEISYTIECIASIIAADPQVPFEIVIADDASTDPLTPVLTKIKNLKIIRQQVNRGFLINCNSALKFCRGELLFLLNNDAQVRPGCIEALVDVFDNDPDTAAAGPKILYPDGRLQEAGCTLDRNGVSTMVGLFDDPTQLAYRYQREVHYCSGAALMVRRSEIGDELFDPRFQPAYCEDADLCLRLLARGRRVIYCPNAEVVHHLSVSTNKQSASRRLQIVAKNQQQLAEKWPALLENINTARVLAFYLPQFHATVENDFHWGQGFTEWSNVTRATPGYVGHYQPHLPADLGFYDLRVRQTVERQVALAQRYGIDGFCVYYYNFGSQRALETAFEAIVSDKTIDFSYCVCWANENWTRHWDGGSREIIFEQKYDQSTIRSVVADVLRYADDPRYVRVNGMPLVLVYRPMLIPDAKAFATFMREAFKAAGHAGVHLVYVESMETAAKNLPPSHFGFDACVEFPPHGHSAAAADPPVIIRDDFAGTRYDYEATILADIRRPPPGYKRYPTVFPSWDNTPRQPLRGDSFVRAEPEVFQAYVQEKLQYLRNFLVGEDRLLFVNAWNEWAEGAHLEPDRKFGHRWLEAIRNARLAESLG